MARPRLPEEEQHISRIAVYLTEEDDQLLRSLAKKKGIPPAVLARSFIVARIDALSMLSSSRLTAQQSA